jgi:diadenosine tetraphosphate (Ap4A) HIT family hydrolase
MDIEPHLLAELHKEAARVGRALVRASGATGLNIFQNNGVDAGQSEPHFHVHVVPRYPGSDPARIFSSKDFNPVPMTDQRSIAYELRLAIAD